MKKLNRYVSCIQIICTMSYLQVGTVYSLHRTIPRMGSILAVRTLSLSLLNQKNSQNSSPQDPMLSVVTDDVCRYVLHASKLPLDSAAPPKRYTFTTLDSFFNKLNIKDYADAAKHGREHAVFDNPDEFNVKMGAIFKKNSTDVVPYNSKRYQAFILATSGVDVFMERLAFVKRLVKTYDVHADDIIALVGSHAHRKDLQNINYLLKLPHLFSSDFALTNFDKETVNKGIAPLVAKKDWTHRDGIDIAWQLVACDPTMKQLKNTFRCFSGNGNSSLRTEQLLEQLITGAVRRPITKDNPIAFIVNSQGSAKTQEMIRKYFANDGSVDLLIARPVADEIEEQLYNDTPQQRAMTKLFHFYRILETVVKAKK
jgi:hypothetical protein